MHLFEGVARVEGEDHRGQTGGVDAAADRSFNQRLDMCGRVIKMPGTVVDRLPLLAGHARMIGGNVLEVVPVEVRFQAVSAQISILMILGSRQWREHEE